MSLEAMPTSGDVERWLASWSYKPGWTFELRYDVVRGQAGVLIQHATDDADGKVQGTIEVASLWLLHWMPMTRQGFLSQLAHEVIRREAHEALERMRVDGRRPFDPHPDGGTAYSPTHYLLED